MIVNEVSRELRLVHYFLICRCRDDISNFRVKIRVRKVVPTATSSTLTVRSSENEDDDEYEGSTSSPTGSVNSTPVWLGNVTLGWQEKVFSPTEENYYRGAKEEDFQVRSVSKLITYSILLFLF